MAVQKVQIIKRKIDDDRLNSNYYNQIKSSIKRNVNDNAEILMIEFIPKKPIENKAVVKTLLHLQREFTDILITPKNTISFEEGEIEKLTDRFKASMIMVGT